MQSSPTWIHGQYRRDIDGLRAWAVLITVGFHAFPEWVGGGFVGVDVFFVISGFLITTQLRQTLPQGISGLVNFYARRVRRIFPATLVVLAAMLGTGAVSLYAQEYEQLGKHTLAAAGFAANWMLWSEVGYFDTAAQTKPLLHFWSLAVEEQFYAVWPIALLVLMRWPRWARYGVWVLMLLSLGTYLQNRAVDASAAFYSPWCRFWELAAGCALAMSATSSDRRTGCAPITAPTSHQVLAAVGVALLCFSAFAWPGFGSVEIGEAARKISPFEPWRIPLSILGAGLLVGSSAQTAVHRLLLSNPVAVRFGLISFPLYLWHWPLLVLLRLQSSGEPAATSRLVAVGVSVLLAWLTFRFVETPLRRRSISRRLILPMLAAMLVVAATGGLVWQQRGFPERLPNASHAQQRVNDWDFPDRTFRQDTIQGATVWRVGGDGPQTLFFGDSAIEQYGPRIGELLGGARGQQRGAIFLTRGGQIPIDGIRRIDNQVTQWETLPLVLQDRRIDRIVVGAAWPLYFNADKLDLGLSGPVIPEYFVNDLPLDQDDAMHTAQTRLITLLKDVQQSGKKVYLLSSIPAGKEFGQRDPAHGRSFILHDSAADGVASVPRVDVERRLARTRAMLLEAAKQSGAVWIDPLDALCDTSNCPISNFKDIGHLRASFVRKHVLYLDVTVMPGNQP